MKLLIVDDEVLIRDVIKEYCLNENYDVCEASNGLDALEIINKENIDLIILDIMMPKLDGFSLCKQIKDKNIPIIILSARTDEFDKLMGFDLGIEDYVTKPFSPKELMARIKANLRKFEATASSVDNSNVKSGTKIKIGPLSLDYEKFEVRVNDKVVDLTLREFEVLKYLANQPGQVVTRELLLEKVWGYEYYGDIRTVDVTVRRIREKIEKDTSNPKILITKRGVGYYIATDY